MSAILNVSAVTQKSCRRQGFVTVSSANKVKRITELDSQHIERSPNDQPQTNDFSVYVISRFTSPSHILNSIRSHTYKAMLKQNIYFSCQIHEQYYAAFETLHVSLFTQKNKNQKLTQGTQHLPLQFEEAADMSGGGGMVIGSNRVMAELL